MTSPIDDPHQILKDFATKETCDDGYWEMLEQIKKEFNPDPLSPGQFPSLGFDNEKCMDYFYEAVKEDVRVTVWRMARVEPITYEIHVYTRKDFNGVMSWGGSVGEIRTVDSLIQVQSIIHHLFTSGGNYGEG